MNKKKNILLTLFSLVILLLTYRNDSTKSGTYEKQGINRRPSSAIEKTEVRQKSNQVQSPESNLPISNHNFLSNRKRTKEVYQRMLTLPSSTQPLDPRSTVDPLEQKFKAQEKSVLGSHHQGNELVARIPKSYFSKEDIYVPFHIKTLTESAPVNTTLQILINNQETKELNPIQTGIYQYHLPLATMKEGSHMITIIAKFKNEEVINQLHFRLDSNLVRQIKSNFADVDAQGNLVFSNDYEFFEAGPYLLEGTLYTENDVLIGKAQTIFTVTPGIRTVNLEFYGYLIHQRKESGHFNLKNIQINQVDENLVTRGNYVKKINQVTPYLKWQQLNSRPFENDLIQEKLSLINED